MASSRNTQQLEDLARLVDPSVRGWMNYYGRFYRSAFIKVLQHLNEALAAWVRRKVHAVSPPTPSLAVLAR
jgi:hypothetical protein